MNKKTVKDVDVNDKKCLVRVDFNVPIADGKITDITRIDRAAHSTIEYLQKNGAKIVLCSHLGRPKGAVNQKYSLRIVAEKLRTDYFDDVNFSADVIGPEAKNKVKNLKPGQILLLENLRFHAEEERNDKEFCRELAEYCDIYVNDAFGTAHREHASTAGIVNYGFAPVAVAGLLMEEEIDCLSKGLYNPKRPFVAILGGAKVSDKIGVINSLLEKVDTLIIGGGMAYTFNAAKGLKVGNSLCEKDKIPLALELMEKAKKLGKKLLLPIDNVIADAFSNDANSKIVQGDIPDGWQGLDVGPKSLDIFEEEILKAGTVIWNGPLGVFEFSNFNFGTRYIASLLAKTEAYTIVGGGDSVAAVTQFGYSSKVDHISTGGGATLEFLEGLPLPGVICLNDK
ncbi:MAG: phosphoglycerate kinase [Christensenellaceae bacterium]|nr:phosphoglycerate kinase [Christensenellaceae bacterium]